MCLSQKNKVKVVFILPSLSPGGAERVMSFVAQQLNKEEYDVSLWVISKPTKKDYKIDGIELIFFNKSRVLKSVYPLIKNLRAHKPKIVVSSIAHLNMMMGFISFLFPKIKFVGREANVLSVLDSFHNRKTRNKPWFRIAYLALDKILCTSNDMINDFKKVYRFPDKKLALINNPISETFENLTISPNKKKHPIQFITVGSLKKQKGHKRIISALSKLEMDFKYFIIGDGTEKDQIYMEIKENGLENKVIHIPFTNNVQNYLFESTLFLQGAYVEGFPNCLLESAAIGLPIVAFNAPGGLNEIVEEGFNGYIANNEAQFLELIRMSVNKKNWDHNAISKQTQFKYGSKTIVKKYENLLKSLIQ